jgi:hypothetical protein
MENGLTIVFDGSFILVGRLDGKKLMRPRILTFRSDGKVDMNPMPLIPPFVTLNKYTGHYPVPDREKEFIATYNRITNGLVDPNG